jgi:hypothetical protein
LLTCAESCHGFFCGRPISATCHSIFNKLLALAARDLAPRHRNLDWQTARHSRDSGSARINACASLLLDFCGHHELRLGEAVAAAEALRARGHRIVRMPRIAGGMNAISVGADGTLRCGAATGSIHKVGADLQAAPSCNGWMFWHLPQRDGLLLLLHELRARIAAQTA